MIMLSVLVALNFTSHCAPYDVNLWRSLLTISKEATLFFLSWTDVSSANRFIMHSVFSVMSLKLIRNNRGPKIDPWGTPAITRRMSD